MRYSKVCAALLTVTLAGLLTAGCEQGHSHELAVTQANYVAF